MTAGEGGRLTNQSFSLDDIGKPEELEKSKGVAVWTDTLRHGMWSIWGLLLLYLSHHSVLFHKWRLISVWFWNNAQLYSSETEIELLKEGSMRKLSNTPVTAETWTELALKWKLCFHLKLTIEVLLRTSRMMWSWSLSQHHLGEGRERHRQVAI